MATPLLRVQDLCTRFDLDEGVLRAVDGVSFEIGRGEGVGLVGESGCGKTIVALSLLDLVPPPGRVAGGRVIFEGEDLREVSRERLRAVRGGEIGMVFQEPGAALNPVYTVGHQIGEVLRAHRGVSSDEARRESLRLLDQVGIPEPESRAKAYPHELSGGMKQRAVIAMATCTEPKLLIADEPTTALDVTVQAEILELLTRLREERGMALLLITHDLPVVAQMTRRVLVMYAGKLMEVGPTRRVFDDPRHPYSRGLVDSVPKAGVGRDRPLEGIPGTVPDLLDLPTGCTFHPRCPLADEGCTGTFPPMRSVGEGRRAACYRVDAV